MSGSSTTEARVARFRSASGAVHVSVNCVGPPGPVVVSSASSVERTGSPYVHRDRDVVHTVGCIRGIETVRVLLVIECPIRVSLEVPLEVRERATTESSQLKLWARDVGRIAILLLQYVVKEFLASSNLYGTLFQLDEVSSLWSLDDVFQDVFG